MSDNNSSNEYTQSESILMFIAIAVCTIIIIFLIIVGLKSLTSKQTSSNINFKQGMTDYNNHNYEGAVEYLKKVPKEDRKDYEIATSKIKECIPKYNKQIIEKANKKASNKDFYGAKTDIEKALNLDSKNKQLISLKQKYDKLYSDKAAQEGKEAEAKRKAEAAAERERLKPKHVVDSDNYDVWKVYLTAGMNTLKINVNGGEEDNVIADINGRNMINEIGIGNYANGIEVEEDGWYRLTIRTTMGYSFRMEHEY